jgi:NAD(P)-dependent dehydrogenase (short-subunit alcohol dehydrogenase family)
MTGESTVAEIEASGGTALGIEVDVTDHEAVNAMVARVVAVWGRVVMSWSQMLVVAVVGPWIPKPAPSTRRSCSLSSR